MWTLEVYPSLLDGQPIERHECEGSLADWLEAQGIDWQGQAQAVAVSLDGQTWPDWAIPVPDGAVLKIRILPQKAVFKAVGKIFKAVFKLFTPKMPKAQSGPEAGKRLDVNDIRANTARLGEVVPEIFGTVRRYPDYLTPPRRYFDADDPRKMHTEMVLCIGRGWYDIGPDDVRIGNTPFRRVPANGASYKLYDPGDSLAADPAYPHWYSAPEVGQTGSTSGLHITAPKDEYTNEDPTNYTYDAVGTTITRPTGEWPTTWQEGDIVRILSKQSYALQEVMNPAQDGRRHLKITGNLKHLRPLVTLPPRTTITGHLDDEHHQQFTGWLVSGQTLSPTQDEIVVDIADGLWWPTSGTHTMSVIAESLACKIESMTPTILTVSGVKKSIGAADDYANWIGNLAWDGYRQGTYKGHVEFVANPFSSSRQLSYRATPDGETTDRIELDFFFPDGLGTVSGSNVNNASIQVVVEVADAQTGERAGTWVYAFSNNTLDQVGYTKRIYLSQFIEPQVTVRRLTAEPDKSDIHTKVEWLGLRSGLKSNWVYHNWTTMTVRLTSGTKLASSAENQINVRCTRRWVIPDGWSGFTADHKPAGLRADEGSSLANAFYYTALQLGYSETDIDFDRLYAVAAFGDARNQHYNHVTGETTGKAMLNALLAPAFAELTVKHGKLTPVQDIAQTMPRRAYSPQNMLAPLKRTFTLPAVDDNDGIEVEYTDPATWEKKVVVAELIGGARQRLAKVSFEGVTDRTTAWRLGMREVLKQKYRRWSYEFSTEMDARASEYMDAVRLFEEVPQAMQTAFILDVALVAGRQVLTLSEALDIENGGFDLLQFSLRFRDGRMSNVYGVEAINERQVRLLSGQVAPIPVDYNDLNAGEPIHCYISALLRHGYEALITKIASSGDSQTNVQAVNYDGRIYEFDQSEPPANA